MMREQKALFERLAKLQKRAHWDPKAYAEWLRHWRSWDDQTIEAWRAFCRTKKRAQR